MIYLPSEDSFLLESVLKDYCKDRIVLDMGTGSGILAMSALNNSAKSVLASDINKEAIQVLKERGIVAIQSDLFEKIKGKFDLIIFNPPYLPKDKQEDQESQVVTTGGKKGDEIILKFLKNTKKHLNKSGVILLLISSLTPQTRILAELNKQKLKHKQIAQEKLFMETLYVWEITRKQ